MSDEHEAWQDARGTPALGSREVHVWRVDARVASDAGRLFALLAPDEVERARRFRFEKDRTRFAVARGLLRTMLGRYLRAEPSRLRFSHNDYGKPALADAGDESPLRFNVAHSGDIVLLAFTRGREIGVDVEKLRADFATEEIAARFFSRREVEALAALPNELRVRSFFRCWTMKEAYIKARGEGLSLALDGFAVSVDPREPASLLWSQGGSEEIARWSLWDLSPGDAYAGALAAEGRGLRVKRFQWCG